MVSFKSILRVLLIFIVLLGISFGFNPIQKTQAQTETALSSCGTISNPGNYYLSQDVGSDGTCFTISGANIILDLNGKTITYGKTAQGNAVYGQSLAVHDIRVTNGTIKQGGNTAASDPVFFHWAPYKLEFDHLNVSYSGDDSNGIMLDEFSSAQIHDNILTPNVTYISNRYNVYSVIRTSPSSSSVNPTGGKLDIYNNKITGNGQAGIGCGPKSAMADIVRIHDNEIRMSGMQRTGTTVVNSYAIGCGGPQLNGFEIYNNTIIQPNARGIAIGGNDTSASQGPTNGKIYNNYIEAQQSIDAEGWYHANLIRVRFGASNIEVYNNTVVGHAGYGRVVAGSPSQARGIYVDCSPPYCHDISVHNNDVKVDTTDPSNDSKAVGLQSGSDISETGPNVKFFNNIVRSNNVHVVISNQGNVTFESNTFILDQNPLSPHLISVSYFPSHGNIFLDTKLIGGASFNTTEFTGAASTDDFLVQWNLDVRVLAGVTPINGATVSASSANEGNINRTTDGNGRTRLTLTQYKNVYGTKTLYTPHNISVSASGYSTKNFPTTMDTSKEMAVVLGGTDGPVISNVVANVDQAAKTAIITWNTDPSSASSLDYGTTTSYGTNLSGGTGTTHSVTINNLQPGDYHFRITAGQNQGIDHTFFLLGTVSGLTLTKSADKTQVQSGDTITYTITYTNNSSSTITNVVITDPVPAGTSNPVEISNGGTASGGVINWNLGNLAAGASGNLTFKVTVN